MSDTIVGVGCNAENTTVCAPEKPLACGVAYANASADTDVCPVPQIADGNMVGVPASGDTSASVLSLGSGLKVVDGAVAVDYCSMVSDAAPTKVKASTTLLVCDAGVVGKITACALAPTYCLSVVGSFIQLMQDGEVISRVKVPCTCDGEPPVHKLTAQDDSVTTTKNTPATITSLTSNDVDSTGQSLEITHVTDPQHGTAVVVNTTTVLYTPDADFIGNDNFTYTIRNSIGLIATACVTVSVVEAERGSCNLI